MNMTNTKRGFIFTFIIFLFILTMLYMNETKEFLTAPYVQHVKNIIRSSENLQLNVSSGYNRAFVQEHWTYECAQNRCVRKFHSGEKNERVTFLSCTMTCGSDIKIWPIPEKATFEKTFEKFKLADVQYNVVTKFSNVADLLHKAMSLFISDLKQINLSSGGNLEDNINDDSKPSNATTSFFNISLHVTESESTLLTLTTDECYELSIISNKNGIDVDLSGKTFFGVRHGLESLEQLIWYDDAVESLKILAPVNITDCPQFNYRGLMLDTSRHYFSVDTIKRIIAGMSHVKLNRFHWHITDSQSFPFVSKKYPELALYGSYSANEVYTHEDIKNIVEFAEVRGIQIIPEIDAPAHAGNGWQWGEEKGLGNLSLCINQQPWESFCGEPSCGQLNPKNDNTFMILESLYAELLELTKSTDYFHIGGDEVNFDCWRQHFRNENINTLWCDFMMEAHERLIKANKNRPIKNIAIWNSDWTKMKCLPSQKFSLQVWLAQPSQIQQFLKANYNILLSHVDAWYFDCGFGNWRDTKGQGSCPPFKAWYTVYNYRPWGSMRLSKDQLKQILGGEACLWTEQVNEDSIDTRIWPRAAAFAERLWSDPQNSVIQKETVNRFSVFHRRFQALGLKSDALFPKYCEQNEEECI